MERMTERDRKGHAYFDDDGTLIRGANGTFHQKKDMTAQYIHDRFVALDKAIERLATYEDTGLTPEEIDELLHRSNGPLHEKLGQWITADQDGRLAVLLCKVGDVVWVNDDCVSDWSGKPMPYKCWVFGIEITGKGKRFHVECYKTGRVFPFHFDKVGKTVFLTREEAEAALAERKERQE